MPPGKRQRKLLRLLGLVLLVIVLLLALMPVWFPWLLKPVAARKGVRYSRYERHGFQKFALRDLTFTNRTLSIRADHIEALMPIPWFWRCVVEPGATNKEPFLRASKWEAEFHKQTTAQRSTATKPVSTYTNVQQTLVVFQTLKRWLPAAALSNGTLRIEQNVLHPELVTWAHARLQISGNVLQTGWQGTVELSPTRASVIEISSKSQQFHSTIQIVTESQGLKIESTNQWRGNVILASAEFARTGSLPKTANLDGEKVSIPPTLLKLEGYEDLSGFISGRWEEDHFLASIKATGQPVPARTNLPPVNFQVSALGDLNSTTIKSAFISAPWLTAQLTRDLKLYFSGPLIHEPATLLVSADFGRQPWVALDGKLSGEAEFAPTAKKFPAVRFHLTGSGIGWPSLKADVLSVEGVFDWPKLNISKAQAGFADNSSAVAQGDLDIQKRSVQYGALNFSGPLARCWLPKGCSYQNLAINAAFEGPFTNLTHRGNLSASGVVIPNLQSLELCCDWSALWTNRADVQIEVSAGKSLLTSEGSIAHEGSNSEIDLKSLQLNSAGTPLFKLQRPTRISLARDSGFSASLESFYLTGAGGAIQADGSLKWPREARVTAQVANIDSRIASDFLLQSLREVEIKNLYASGGWSNGAAVFEVKLSASTGFPEASKLQANNAGSNSNPLSVSIALNLKGNENGLTISNLLISSATSAVASAEGFLPLDFQPSVATNRINLDPTKPLRLVATAQPHALLWDMLSDWTCLSLQEPNLSVNVSGTWPNPLGNAQLAARQVQLRTRSKKFPNLEDLRVSVELDRESARLNQCELLVEKQPLRAVGELPLGNSFWSNLREKHQPNWERASGHVVMEKVELSAFHRFLPDFFAADGLLNLNVSLDTGLKFNGSLDVENVRTRPLPNLGTVRDIQLHLKFSQQTASLDQASASVGGATVRAAGQADLQRLNLSALEIPPFRFTLRGTNVPLSREPEAIIRSDLDLAVNKTNAAPAVISGTARLRNSFFLRDLAALVPGKVSGPETRPPYFSVTNKPLSDWPVDVHVVGDSFLTVRTPLFNGRVSSNLRIQGTLQEPSALGDLRIASGTVRFPFANLEVSQGLVTLSSGDPYHPQLNILAGSKKFGYDVRMELTGPADAPLIQFSSTPPLSSEQLVLMLTAGEVPRNEPSLSPQQKAQTVAIFFGKDLLARLGLSDQAEERLTVRSGEEMSERGTPTYNVEYKLTDRWSLVGEYDRFNAFNAGVKWRIYSK